MTEQECTGGYRSDGTIWKMKLRLPPAVVHDRDVTAVVGFCLRSGEILAVQNARGWDIPGGHVDPGETPHEALVRELSEEAAFVVTAYCLIAYLETDYLPKRTTFMSVYTINGNQGNFIPSSEISACQFMRVEEFLQLHNAGKEGLMRPLIEIAQAEQNHAKN